jgi:hypothetical protein
VHDKALLYYRLLTTNTEASGKLFASANTDSLQRRIAQGGHFAEETDEELLDQLFAEFNTLAVIYGKPSKQFIADEFLLTLPNAAAMRLQRIEEVATAAEHGVVTSVVQHGFEEPGVQPQSQESVNLLDWGDDAPVASSSSGPSQATGLQLDGSSFVLSPGDFQQNWGSFAEAAPLPNNNLLCCLAALPDELSEVEHSMAQVNVRNH